MRPVPLLCNGQRLTPRPQVRRGCAIVLIAFGAELRSADNASRWREPPGSDSLRSRESRSAIARLECEAFVLATLARECGLHKWYRKERCLFTGRAFLPTL